MPAGIMCNGKWSFIWIGLYSVTVFSMLLCPVRGGESVESVLKKKKKEGYGGEVGQQCREIIKG